MKANSKTERRKPLNIFLGVSFPCVNISTMYSSMIFLVSCKDSCYRSLYMRKANIHRICKVRIMDIQDVTACTSHLQRQVLLGTTCGQSLRQSCTTLSPEQFSYVTETPYRADNTQGKGCFIFSCSKPNKIKPFQWKRVSILETSLLFLLFSLIILSPFGRRKRFFF